MSSVFHVYSRLEAPVAAVKSAINNDEIELPDGIADLEYEHVNGKLQIQAVPEDESVGRYTPAATIKAGLSEDTVVVEDDGTVTHQSLGKYKQEEGWAAMGGEDDEYNTRKIKYADFYGRGEEVLVHQLLRPEMFDVLCQFAAVGTSGFVRGIRLDAEGSLDPVWFDAGGEEVDAELTVKREDTHDPADEDSNENGQTQRMWTSH